MKIEQYFCFFSIFVVFILVSEAVPSDTAAADDGVDPRGLFYENENSESASLAKKSHSLLNYDNYPQYNQPGIGYPPVSYPQFSYPSYPQYPPPTSYPVYPTIPQIPSYPSIPSYSPPIASYPSYPSYPNYRPGNSFGNLEYAQKSSEASSASKNEYMKYINTGLGGGLGGGYPIGGGFGAGYPSAGGFGALYPSGGGISGGYPFGGGFGSGNIFGGSQGPSMGYDDFSKLFGGFSQYPSSSIGAYPSQKLCTFYAPCNSFGYGKHRY